MSINDPMCILYAPLSRTHNVSWSRKKNHGYVKKSFLDFSVTGNVKRIFSSNRRRGTRGDFKVDAQNLAASRSRLCSVFCGAPRISFAASSSQPAGLWVQISPATRRRLWRWKCASSFFDNVSSRKFKNMPFILIVMFSMDLIFCSHV